MTVNNSTKVNFQTFGTCTQTFNEAKTCYCFVTGLNLEVELLVRAHECHTLACNMEGIAAVLRNGRVLTTALAETRDYMLMVICFSVL